MCHWYSGTFSNLQSNSIILFSIIGIVNILQNEWFEMKCIPDIFEKIYWSLTDFSRMSGPRRCCENESFRCSSPHKPHSTNINKIFTYSILLRFSVRYISLFMGLCLFDGTDFLILFDRNRYVVDCWIDGRK